MIEHSERLVEKLNQFKDCCDEWDISPFISRCALDIICGKRIDRMSGADCAHCFPVRMYFILFLETAMGVKLDDEEVQASEYLQKVTE